MNTGKLIFAQLMDYLQLPVFRKCVKQYAESNKSISFSYLDQFLYLAFIQLIYRETHSIDAQHIPGFTNNIKDPLSIIAL